jgi:hypothetical protein
MIKEDLNFFFSLHKNKNKKPRPTAETLATYLVTELYKYIFTKAVKIYTHVSPTLESTK